MWPAGPRCAPRPIDRRRHVAPLSRAPDACARAPSQPERRAFSLPDDYRHQLSPPVHSHCVSRAGARRDTFNFIRLAPAIFVWSVPTDILSFCCSSNSPKYENMKRRFVGRLVGVNGSTSPLQRDRPTHDWASPDVARPPRPLRSLGEGPFRQACRNYISEN